MRGHEKLKKEIDALPNGTAKNEFLTLYNKHFGGVATQDSGGGGNGGGDPPK